MELIATFSGSHAALAAEQALLGAGLAVELIPVPRQIHSDCGFCLLSGFDPGTAESGRRLQLLRDWGAQGLWLVSATPHSASSRKVKNYERYP
jgi:hypothetical protein